MKNEIEILTQALTRPLPGVDAQRRMSPSVRFTGSKRYNEAEARISSVLILLYKKGLEWYVPLIQRPKYDGAHSGQISFPGGKYEEGDVSHLDTALREAYEEIGIDRHELSFVRQLSSLYIPNSNFIVYPQVCITESEPVFVPDCREVETIIEVPVRQMLSPATIHRFVRNINGVVVDAPFYKVDNHIIWGATAMITSEFLSLLESCTLFSNRLEHSCNAYNAPECH